MSTASLWSGIATDSARSTPTDWTSSPRIVRNCLCCWRWVLRAACSPIQRRWHCCSAHCRAEKSCSGLVTVVVFSLGFAATLVVVGIVAAKVGEKVLDWLASIWMVRLQIATSLLIVGMGVVLTIRAVSELAALPAG